MGVDPNVFSPFYGAGREPAVLVVVLGPLLDRLADQVGDLDRALWENGQLDITRLRELSGEAMRLTLAARDLVDG